MASSMTQEKHPDWIDEAKATIERATEEKIQEIQGKARFLEAPITGECLDCGKKFKEGDKRRWCNAVCRDSWQQDQDYLKRRK